MAWAAQFTGHAARTAGGRSARRTGSVGERWTGRSVQAQPAPEVYTRRSPAPDTWPAPRPGHRTLRSSPCPRPVPGTHRPVRAGGSPLGVCRSSGRRSPAPLARGPSASGGRGGSPQPSGHPRSTPAVHPRPTLGRQPARGVWIGRPAEPSAPRTGSASAPGTARCVHRLARVPCPAPTAQSVRAAVLSGCAARAAGKAQRLSHGVRRRALGGVAARPQQAPEPYTRRFPAPDTWPATRSWCVHRAAGRAQRLSHGVRRRAVDGAVRPSLAGTRGLLPPVTRAQQLAGTPLVVCDSSGRRSPAPLARARRRPRAPHAAFTALSPSAVPRARHSPPSPHRRQSSRGVPPERPAKPSASRTGSVGERWAEWRLVPSRHPSPTPAGSPRPTLGRQPARRRAVDGAVRPSLAGTRGLLPPVTRAQQLAGSPLVACDSSGRRSPAPLARGPSASGGRGGSPQPSRHPRSTPAVHPRPTLGRQPARGVWIGRPAEPSASRTGSASAPGTARRVHRPVTVGRASCPALTAKSTPAAVLSGCAARAAGKAQRLSHGVRRRALGGVAARPRQAPETHSRRSPAPDAWPATRSGCVDRAAGRAQRPSHGLGVGPGHRTPRSPPCHRRPCLVPGTHRQVHTGGSPLGVCRPSGRQSPAPLARGPSTSVGRSGGSSPADTRDPLPPFTRARRLAGTPLVVCPSGGRHSPAPLARARRRPRAPHAAFTAWPASRARHPPPSPCRRQSSRGVPPERPA